MEDETWVPALAGIAAVISILLVFSHYKELRWLRITIVEDRSKIQQIVLDTDDIAHHYFYVFPDYDLEGRNATINKISESAMYTALTYTLFLVALRAVILVGASFSAIVTLHQRKNIKDK